MGVAKAALEASVRYLAVRPRPRRDPGQRDQRGPGPDARRGRHRGLQGMYRGFDEIAPLRANITPRTSAGRPSISPRTSRAP
jgi:hypothetical protein